MHIAAQLGNLEFARLLLETGADKDAENGVRAMPLSIAADKGYLEVVQLLQEQGAKYIVWQSMMVARWKICVCCVSRVQIVDAAAWECSRWLLCSLTETGHFRD